VGPRRLSAVFGKMLRESNPGHTDLKRLDHGFKDGMNSESIKKSLLCIKRLSLVVEALHVDGISKVKVGWL
jgi:hypothetical protein